MSDQVELAIIGLAVVIAQGVFAVINQRNHVATQASVETVRQDVNGKMAQLLQVTGAAEHAKGKLEGAAETIKPT